MSKMLIVAEKPSVAKDIAAALGGFSKVENWLESDTAVVSCAVGHLVELFAPEAATTGRDLSSLPIIPARFAMKVLEPSKAQYLLLERLMARRDISSVVNACDAGREGELIFRLIYEKARCTKPMKRMWLQSMTADAIRDAYRTMKPGSAFDNLSDAAKCRSEADWVVGINGSRGISDLRGRQTHRRQIMAAGRVQTPTLAILVHQEQKIRNFVPQDYWEVHGTFGVQAGTYVAKWFNPNAKEEGEEGLVNRFTEKAKAEQVANKCRGVAPSSVTDTSKPVSKAAPRLFDLTSLQREANKKLKFSAKKTLDIAQALYEKHKATTYPRTDSTALPEDYVPTVAKTLNALAGTAYETHAKQVLANGWMNAGKRIYDNAKISDHFAIVPTGVKPASLTAEEAKIYDMIVRRFLAAFFPAAEYLHTTRITVVSGESFKSTGKVLTAQGWLAVYGVDIDDDGKTPSLCVYQPGEPVKNVEIVIKDLKTKPPTRFTEATLLSAMENAGKLVDDDDLRDAMKERGLGTPATRAATIEGLLSRVDGRGEPKEPYVDRKDNWLVPTPKGMDLIGFLDMNGIDALTSPRMTGEWEQKLRQMEAGQYARDAFMAEIGELTRHIIDAIRQKAPPSSMLAGCACPKCGAGVVSGGPTYVCEANCGFALWREIAGRMFNDEEIAQLLADRQTPTLDGFLSKKKTPFSAALKMNDEFKLEFVFLDDPQTALRNSLDASGNSVTCPACQSLMRRIKGKKGWFWACTNREAECKKTMNDENGHAVASNAGTTLPNGATVACPQCTKPMRRIKGQKSYFWGCTGYADGCRSTLEDKNGKPVPKTSKPAASAQDAGAFL
ncbi:DNA topoisomerase 3 [Noviherbaspirillum pedocola]|uniref:DNA topoisomerase n=1 Tax=Noviherbaspirillum pedocola TaxID=2801341 RepID=A0A934T0T3_9BURK|nr:DNA topoisomerase 3 [Noviherbaspirillum pedocola]MBK4738920.1 DNA topoisomerase 3 [Noviherbaspirillum pedocola]